MLVVFENGIQVNVETSVAMQMLALAFNNANSVAPVAPVAPVVIEEPKKTYTIKRVVDEIGYDFGVVAKNGGIVATTSDGKYLTSALRKVANHHLKVAGFKWDATDKCFKGGDASKINYHITQQEFNDYADKRDARNARKYGD